jgi:pyruvate formate lyase activating enzyme
LSHPLTDGRIQCDVCPRACQLREGQTGFCYVRAARDGAVVLTGYGRASGFCIDPIEKKPLNHFLPGTPVLSFGTAGCNLACRYCQNWDISKSRDQDTLAVSASPEAIAARAAELGCRSVAYTYNDPVIFLEYAVDTALACRERGVRNVAVTAGYVSPGAREAFFAPMDAANVDLKAFTDDFYHRVCGGHLEPVKETLVYLRQETRVWLELTTLLIPGYNDSEAEIDAMTAWVVETLGPDVPMHFTAFHPDWKLREVPATPPATLARARAIARRNGVRHAYTGNVHDPQGGSTWCHQCGALLIERDWYRLGHWGLDAEGRCAACGTPCPGVFEAHPGDWGSRRQPVTIAPQPGRH